MARVIWKGSISFGLVQVPISLYSAEARNELKLSMLDQRDLSPVGYKRINKSTGEDVPWGSIVKGYEYEKGDYVLLGEEDFRKANLEATQTVQILDFVDAAEIPLTYFDCPYYLEPDKRGKKGYALLRETLSRTGKAGIARVVLHTREHLAALVPQGDMLVLNLLRFHDELRDPAEFSVPSGDLEELGVSPKELDMAQRLVESMVEPWEPERYHDQYRDDLLERIEEKIRTGQTHEIEKPPKEKGRPRAEVIDLMSQLKRSVEETQKQRRKPAGRSKGGGKRTRKRA